MFIRYSRVQNETFWSTYAHNFKWFLEIFSTNFLFRQQNILLTRIVRLNLGHFTKKYYFCSFYGSWNMFDYLGGTDYIIGWKFFYDFLARRHFPFCYKMTLFHWPHCIQSYIAHYIYQDSKLIASLKLPYSRHHNPLLIINCSWL